MTFALYILCAVLVLWPKVPSSVALLLGLSFSLLLGNPLKARTAKLISITLPLAIVGLGAGMDFRKVLQVGAQGFLFTLLSLFVVFGFSYLLSRLFRIEKPMGILVGVGTAICGGSAIAAVAPVIRAKPEHISLSLAIVFLLNAVGLLIFPFLGEAFDLTQSQFGLWSALAIHDTSSVVGATMQYGPLALEVGTSVKLARAMWIVPLTLVFSSRWFQGATPVEGRKPKRPWFILGFLICAAVFTYSSLPGGQLISSAAQRLLVFSLFLIGSQVTLQSLRQVGFRPFLFATSLWAVTASLALVAVLVF